jgi:hypothetical protein
MRFRAYSHQGKSTAWFVARIAVNVAANVDSGVRVDYETVELSLRKRPLQLLRGAFDVVNSPHRETAKFLQLEGIPARSIWQHA